jgi:hypothetical protein
LGKSLVGDARSFVQAIIQEFLKLEVLGPIMRMLFPSAQGEWFSGAGGGLGASQGGGLGSFGGSNSIIGSAFTAFNAPGGALSGLTGGSNLAGLGNNAWNWLSGGGAAFDSTSGMYLMSSSDALGLVPDYGGLGASAGEFGGEGALSSLGGDAGTYGGEVSSAGGSGLGSALGIAGGVYAGYNEFNAAGGGAAGVIGGAAYGIGTIAATGVISGMLGGAGAAAGMAGAMGSIGLAAIPVVGWIALAAMLVNMISGGKLFGTAAKPIGGEFTETVGAGGISLSDVMHEKG